MRYKVAAWIFLFVIFSSLLLAEEIASIPTGFKDQRDSSRLKEAWKGKTLKIKLEEFGASITGRKEVICEFNDFETSKIYEVKTNGSNELKAQGKVELLEYMNIDSPGIDPGSYVLTIFAAGFTFQISFQEVIPSDSTSFKDSSGNQFEIH
ncbi:MAG: hypothetical protein HQM10_04485 [Candidatus Riflebacteria bacterium]|nr:hypothetical protein [Candidatus Riflebacteria bacterium]